MSGSEILKRVLLELDKNYNELAKELGIPTQNLYDIRDGKIKKVSAELAIKIIKLHPKFNVHFLIEGKEPMLNEQFDAAILNKVIKNEAQLEVLIQMVSELLQPNKATRASLLNALSSKVQEKILLIEGSLGIRKLDDSGK